MFKQRHDFIEYIWNYKQPPDSDASWIGHDITPKTLSGVLKLYLRLSDFGGKLDFWEGHHGSEKYFKQYFLLILAHIISKDYAGGGKYQIDNFKLPDLHIYKMSNLEHSIDEFVEMANDLKQNQKLLEEVGFSMRDINEIFDTNLIPFFNRLKEEVKSEISKKHMAGNISAYSAGNEH